MASCSHKTFKVKNNSGDANDLHLDFDKEVDVQGVDGVAPTDPNAEYTLEGDGSSTLDLEDIDVASGKQLKIRVKARGNKPSINLARSYWTNNGNRLATDPALAQATVPDVDGSGETALALRDLGQKIEQLIESVGALKEKCG
jgi:hypothetical protein